MCFPWSTDTMTPLRDKAGEDGWMENEMPPSEPPSAPLCWFFSVCAVLHVFFTFISVLIFSLLVSLPWTIFMEVWRPSRDNFMAIECHAKCAKLCERESRRQTFPTTSVQWRRRAPLLLLKGLSEEGNLHSFPRWLGMTWQSKLQQRSRRNTGVINDSLFQYTRLLWREVGHAEDPQSFHLK